MSAPVFDCVLVANRGEIAIRVMRTLREMGIRTIAVHSDVERDAPHVAFADEAIAIGPGPVSQSYLRVDRIISAARQAGAQAVHPGYGLLSENPEFAEACEQAGLVFIGPSAASMRAMGSKVAARELMAAAGVPVVPGSRTALEDIEAAERAAQEVGYPVAIKASGAGGGKGFRVARDPAELASAFQGARDEGERYFNDGTVYLERYLDDPRHVEVQLLADDHGNVVHLFERDCSVQRRHQKLIEEAPAPQVSPELRQRIGQIAIEAAKSVGYRSAGTIEGMLVGNEFYFLEMNTRIQVEHCVTEAVTGIDIVEQQVLIAAGQRLSVTQEQVTLTGHAIECRINAEDASKGFLPSPGTISTYREPAGAHVRVDSGVDEGSQVLPYYDPMLAKLVVWGAGRSEATSRMIAALDQFEIEGIRTLIPFHRALLATDQWKRGETCRDLVEDRKWLRSLRSDEG